MKYRLVHSDVLAALRALPDRSAQCVVTSPPYWGLRDYGLPPSIWLPADLRDCPEPICTDGHEWGDRIRHKGGAGTQGATSQRVGRQNVAAQERQRDGGSFCVLCGAWRGCLGLEPTPELFVEHIVAVFREVRRILRDDGTLWINLGDSYNAYNGGAGPSSIISAGAQTTARPQLESGYRLKCKDLKPKDLIGIPWMVAFALRADGWYLRSEIIWHKPNPMPESVTDRPTKAHEQMFLLAKSAKYFYDADAIKEPASWLGPNGPAKKGSPSEQNFYRICGKNPKGNAKTFRGGGAYTNNRSFDNSADVDRDSHGNAPNEDLTRNKRSVWTIATEPFPEAHFATFPRALVEPCILAGSKAGDLVLDPFSGSGTVGVVALGLLRDYLGIELNPEYLAMSRRRLEGVAPMFAQEVAG